MKARYLLVACLFTALACQAQEPDNKTLAERLQEFSVTVKTDRAEGSGVVKTRDGINYVWTAGHVIDDLRTTREVVDSKTGTKRYIVEFRDASIVKNLYEDGRKVGQIEMLAEVIRYSNADHGEDLALLRVRKRGFITASAQFYLEERIPSIGTDLLHVGSLRGQFGSNSVTDGVLSQTGRLLDSKVYDQTTVTAFPGSSGGGVYLKSDGHYVGMLTRGAGETFNLIVPVRRIKTWAERNGVTFALDDKVPVPTADEIKKLPIEDTGKDFERAMASSDTEKSFPFLIVTTRPAEDQP